MTIHLYAFCMFCSDSWIQCGSSRQFLLHSQRGWPRPTAFKETKAFITRTVSFQQTVCINSRFTEHLSPNELDMPAFLLPFLSFLLTLFVALSLRFFRVICSFKTSHVILDGLKQHIIGDKIAVVVVFT